jgi:phage I-like protein
VALSAQLIELAGAPPTTVRLLPAGQFRAKDGRPQGLPGWTLDAPGAERLIEAASRQADRFLIDYDHQTLHAKTNGAKAPAAGWFSQLEWREGDGLYALNVEWTDAAAAAITAKEYRYLSPVLTFDAATGTVTGLLMAALVNFPALDGLTDLAAAAAQLIQPRSKPRMNALMNRLGLPDDADETAALAALDAIMAERDQARASHQAALSAAPDPARYAPIEALSALQTELATLRANARQAELAALLEPALADGRLLPAQQEWAQALGQKDIAALQQFLSTAQPLAALAGQQTGGKPPDTAPPANPLDPNTIYTARRAAA